MSKQPTPRPKRIQYDTCVNCNEPFCDRNTHTIAGWRETQISGFCEDCFDEIMQEAEEEIGYDGPGELPF